MVPSSGADSDRQHTRSPQPGDVYREFCSFQAGESWRVSNPQVANPRARTYLPNPVHSFSIPSLKGAYRAEAMIERWTGHRHTEDPRIRFNESPWLDVPAPLETIIKSDAPVMFSQDNPIFDIPLEYLREGENTFEGISGHRDPDGWGHWGIYSLMVRVYYEPEEAIHPFGRITTPVAGDSITENPKIEIEADSHNGISRIQVLAYYDGYDVSGNGIWKDWHGFWHQANRSEVADLREHVGTLLRRPYELTWDTRWVPDQEPGTVKLVARIQDSRGAWIITDVVDNLSLVRKGKSVRTFPASEFPEYFGVRNGARQSCVFDLGEVDPDQVIEAGMHLRTWHGWDEHHHPMQFNGHETLIRGKYHFFHYDILPISPSILRPGKNELAIASDTVHHTLEMLRPGPALTVRMRRSG